VTIAGVVQAGIPTSCAEETATSPSTSRTIPAHPREKARESERNWSWLQRKISYRTFEQAVHIAFESGMAMVVRKCRHPTPNTALLVILGAALWFPISLGIATAMRAVLFARVTSWPAWMQLLHPLATVIAKSKLFGALGIPVH